MQSRDFAFWLQGFFELTDSDNLKPDQIKMIKTHLSLVFAYDPDMAHAPSPKRPLVRPAVPDRGVLWLDDTVNGQLRRLEVRC